MTHITRLSRPLPAKAEGLPESHTIEFIISNLPNTLVGTVLLAIYHIKNWPE